MEKEYGFVIISGILSGLIVFGERFLFGLGLSLYQIVILTALFTFLLLPLLIWKKELRPKREMLPLFVAFGLIDAIAVLSETISVILGTPVAVAVLLLYTQPLWTIIISKTFMKEKIRRRKILAATLVLPGIILLANPFEITSAGNFYGIIAALVGGVALSGYVIFGRIAGKRKYHPIATKIYFTVFALLFFAASYPLMAFLIKDPAITSFSLDLPASTWIYLAFFGTFGAILPHVLYFMGARKVPASTSGIVLLLEPVSAAILAALFLQQPITLTIILGGAIILASNYLVISKGGKEK